MKNGFRKICGLLFLAIGFCSLFFCVMGRAEAGSFVVERVPDGGVKFDRLALLNDRDVAFRGIFLTEEGFHTAKLFKFNDGILLQVVDEDTPIPDRDDHFRLVGSTVSIFRFGDAVAFLAGRQGATHEQATGIYTERGGQLATLVDDNTPVPEGSGNFISFDVGLELGDDKLAFAASGSGQHGIYVLEGGTLSKVVDRNTKIPGFQPREEAYGHVETFDDITRSSMISLGDGNIAFHGGNGPTLSVGHRGIYKTEEGALVIVANTDTPIPGGSGTFFAFSGPVFRDLIPFGTGGLAFIGYGATDQKGIYTYVDGVLGKVVDLQTPAPDGSGNFIDIRRPIILGNGRLAFFGTTPNGSSIYTVGQEGIKELLDLTNTGIPGSFEQFRSFGDLVPVGHESVAFTGEGFLRQEGIYTNFGGDLAEVVGPNTQIPEGTGKFTEIVVDRPFFGGEKGEGLLPIRDGVAFVGRGIDQEGVYFALLDEQTTDTGDDDEPEDSLQAFSVSKTKITLNKKNPQKSNLLVQGQFEFSTDVELKSTPVSVIFFAGPHLTSFSTSPGFIACNIFVCKVTPERSSFTRRKERKDSTTWTAKQSGVKFTIVRRGSNWTFKMKAKKIDVGQFATPAAIGLVIRRRVGSEPFGTNPLDFQAVGGISLDFRVKDTKSKTTFLSP